MNKASIVIEVLTVGRLFYRTGDVDSDADLVTDLVELYDSTSSIGKVNDIIHNTTQREVHTYARACT